MADKRRTVLYQVRLRQNVIVRLLSNVEYMSVSSVFHSRPWSD